MDLPRRRRGRNHRTKGIHGDRITRDNSECIRILLHNTGGIGFMTSNRSVATLKTERLKKLVIQNNVDLVCLTEVNKDWRNVENDQTIWGATATWKDNRRVQVSQNTTKPPQESEYLVGGTAMVAFDDLVFPISNQGQDSRNLGRWGFVTINGKNELKTSIFTCYCPTRNTLSGSVYSQHLTYMAENRDSIPDTFCPRQLFGMDLKLAIEERIYLGHQVIVMGDFNAEYEKLKIWMMQLGLQDIIAKKHGLGPKTYERSKDSPIDCIFGSAQLSISLGGFLSFGKLMGDHRGLWVDLPKAIIYGYNPPAPKLFRARKLKLLDPRVVKKYQNHLHTSMQFHDLFQRMEDLHRQTVYPLPQHLIEQYEEIYCIVDGLMAAAEKQCRKLRTGTIPWSPIYKNSCQQVLYWLMRKSYFLKKHRNVRKLIVLQNKLNIKFNNELTLVEIETKIRTAYKLMKKCKADAESLSLEYRTQLAIAKEEAGDIKAATFLLNMNRIENLRRIYRNIRYMEKKTRAGSTRKITCIINGIPVEYTGKAIIEYLMAQENARKYHQTEGSSQLLNPYFVASLGKHGEGPDVHKVLNGSYVFPPSTSSETMDFINNCVQGEKAKLLSNNHPDVVSRYKSTSTSWDVRKEKTCTYHHHLGHYKSIFNDKRLAWFFFQREDIPKISGYSPKSHRECVDLMIMKKEMCFDIKKQRTIGILDTEFNQANKLIGREAMIQAIDQGKIADEQFAIKNTAAIDQTIAKRCFLDHNRSKRTCFSLTSSDLAGCYDRIVHTAAALALLRVGIPHSRIHSMFNSIQRMIHYIRTDFGDSKISYGGDDIGNWENFPQGVLQGNAAGPTIWAVLSSVVFEILHKRGFGVKFCTSLSKQVFLLVGFSYVDDCDLIQSGSSPIQVLQSMQDLINNWGSVMKVTGGAISVEKSWWYLVDFVWAHGKWIAHDAEPDADLVASSSTGEILSLKRLYCNEASKMLGVWIAPDGSNNKLVEELQWSALDWSAKVKSGNPSAKEAWQALHTTITAKLKYPLSGCSLSVSECKSIMNPVIKSALPKSGISSKLPISIRDCPSSCGGAGVLSLFDYQGTSRTAMLIEQIHRKSTTGMLLLQNIEDLVLETGLFGSLWSMNFDKISKYISTHSLIYHILSYNASNEIRLHIPHTELCPKRAQDKSIMQLALLHFSSSTDLKAIQRVRMYLGIVCLSDICSMNGKHLERSFHSTTQTPRCRNTFIWPSVHHVTKLDIGVWRKFMCMLFSRGSFSLYNSLGPWITMSYEDWLQSWDYFVTSDRQFIYHKIGPSSWKRHLKKPNSNYSYHIESLDLTTPPETDLLRATVSPQNNRLQVLASGALPPINLPPSTIISFDTISVTKPTIKWFMKNLTSSPNTFRLRQHLIAGTAYAVSDGSFFPDSRTGAAAWIVATPDGLEWIQGGGIIPGSPEDQDPYRSELGGQLGLAAFCSGFLLPTIDKPTLTVACDGKSALSKVFSGRAKLKARHKHIDLISVINELWEDAPFNIVKEHVYGHQDILGRILTQLEELNCRVDVLAKEIALHQILLHTPPPAIAPTSLGFGSIYCSNHLVTGNIQSTLYRHITCKKLISWIAYTSDTSINLKYTDIHWISYRKARKEARFGIKRFITKWLGNSLATGKVMVKRQHRLCSNCPVCATPNEDQLHILTCTSSLTMKYRSELLSDLASWFKSSYTHPSITIFFLKGLKTWFQNPTHQFSLESDIFTGDEDANYILMNQLNLGWYTSLGGFLSPSLITLQQSHYTETSSRKSSLRWATNLTTKLWTITYQLWCHRNDVLHSNDNLQLLSGFSALKKCISFEHSLGKLSIPPVYSSYFHIPLQSLLLKNSSYLRKWFLVIRSARESYSDIQTVDEFSINGPLRKWVALQPIT